MTNKNSASNLDRSNNTQTRKKENKHKRKKECSNRNLFINYISKTEKGRENEKS